LTFKLETGAGAAAAAAARAARGARERDDGDDLRARRVQDRQHRRAVHERRRPARRQLPDARLAVGRQRRQQAGGRVRVQD
jgi:hypothetical protein